MKPCAYCGKANDDAATRCFECGTDLSPAEPAARPSSPDPAASSPGFRLRDILTDPPRLFRALVIVANGAYFLSLIAPYVESRFLSYDTIDLLRRNGECAWLTLPTGVFWLVAILYLAIAVGLYQFSAPARTLFLIFTVAFGVLVLFNGVRIYSPLVSFLGLVSGLADGAILLLAYATPLKERFS